MWYGGTYVGCTPQFSLDPGKGVGRTEESHRTFTRSFLLLPAGSKDVTSRERKDFSVGPRTCGRRDRDDLLEPVQGLEETTKEQKFYFC